MKDDIDLSKIFNREPQVRRLDGFPTVINTNQVIDKQRMLIKTQAELETFLKTIDPTGITTLPEKIDFEKEYLIGVSTKTLNNTGTSLKVRKLYEDKEDKKLLASIKQEVPNEKCPVNPQLNIVADLVAISKTDFAIDYELIKEIQAECENE